MDGQITILLGGKERIVKFNHSAIYELGKVLQVDPALVNQEMIKISKENPFRVLTFIIYCGIVGFHEEECNYTHGITLKDVSKWLNNADYNEFTSVWALWRDSTEVADILKDFNASKKKAEAKKA